MKPDPPENVVARPVPSNPRRLEVTWQTPSTWPDPESFPLKFFLRYRPLILDQWQHVSALPCPDPECLNQSHMAWEVPVSPLVAVTV